MTRHADRTQNEFARPAAGSLAMHTQTQCIVLFYERDRVSISHSKRPIVDCTPYFVLMISCSRKHTFFLAPNRVGAPPPLGFVTSPETIDVKTLCSFLMFFFCCI